MEQRIKSNEWKLQNLLEQKNFSELSIPEKELVKELITKEEYLIRRELIVVTKEESDSIIPLPLVFPVKKTRVVIPLYQAFFAVAATALVMLFLRFPYSNLGDIKGENEIKYVSVTDTIKEIEYVYDTVYKEIEKTKIVEKKVYVPKTVIKYVESYSESSIESTEVLNSPNTYKKPDFKSLIDEVDGSESLADEIRPNLFPVMMYRD
jgi:hypothetical protein